MDISKAAIRVPGKRCFLFKTELANPPAASLFSVLF
jgi:hypothetical protein